MNDYFAPRAFGDDGEDVGEDLAALDFSAPAAESAEDDLAALEFAEPPADAGDDGVGPLFTATNPPGTVTVTTYLNGRVHQLELAARSTSMTETELAQEILAVTRLASMKARCAQGAFIVDAMSGQVDDDAAVRDIVERMAIPTPRQVAEAEQAIVAHHRTDG